MVEQKTVEYYMEQLSIAKKVGDRSQEGHCYANLGNAYGSLGDFKRAIEYQERSLRIAKEVGDKSQEGHCHANLGNAYWSLGDFKRAVEYQEVSLKIAKEVGDKFQEGHCYANLGNAHWSLGDFEGAIEYQERSLRIAKKVGDKSQEGHCYANLGNAYCSLGDFKRAIEYQEVSLSIAKEVGDKSQGGHCYANLGNAYGSLGDFKQAIEYKKLSLSIAKELGNLAEEARACYALGCEYQVLGSFHEALNYFQSSVALLHLEKISLIPNLYQDVHTHLWKTLLEIERTDEALLVAEQGRVQAVIDIFGNYDVGSLPYEVVESKKVTADIVNYFSAQTVFVALEGKTVNFWVCCKETGVQFIQEKVASEENATAFLDGLIDSARKICLREERAGLSHGENSSLRLLYDAVISPIAHVLKSEEIIIVPDGPLRRAPFVAFVDQYLRFFGETTRIRMIPSLTFLKAITNCPAEYHRRSGALLVGDPFMGELTGKSGKPILTQLPFAKKEVEMIGNILQTTPLTGKRATKEEVLKLITSVALVHFACDTCMEDGAIALAPNPARASKGPIPEEEFLLTTADVLAFQLRARLVVLSCNGPGTVSIAHAFLRAGARSVLASVWPVDDEATFEFMKSFYEHLVLGNSTSMALQGAMKYLRKSENFGAVKYWAPFVLIGDDVTLEFGEEEERCRGKAVPSEINLRGRLALEAYNKALTEGKAYVKRVPVMIIGQDRSGKTSLKRSLMGNSFNPDEDSTVGIDVDPSHFKVSGEIWRPGKNDQATNDIDITSFEHHAARLVAEELKEEKRDTKSMRFGYSEFKKESSLDVPRLSSNNAAALPVDIRKSAPASETARDATESIHTKVDVRKRVPETFLDPVHRREEHLPHIAKIPDEVAILIKKVLKEIEEVQDEEDIYSVLWDFGGQSVYYATHPLFMTAKAMYLLVYDLSRDPCAIAEPVVKQGRYKRILDNHGAKSNLDYLKFWLTSVASLASQDEDQHVRLGRVQVNIPAVFLVCTHADEPYGGANPVALAREVVGSLQTKPYRNQLYKSVFVVDNTKSGTESECSEVICLREKVLAVAKELPHVKEAIPIKWLKFEKALEVTVKGGQKWISFEMAKQIASEVCRIKDDQEFLTLLNFLHDQRILIHFDDTLVLNNMVVLDPQWLVEVFSKVITVTPYDQDDDEVEFEELWDNLESTGILDEKLLEHVWGPLFDQQETSASFIEIMEKFSLLCPWPSSDASCGKQYLVPSMLNSHPPRDIIELVASAQIPSLFLKFESGQVPPGLFPRLVLQFFQWGQNEFLSSENPQLYHNFARFYTSGDEDCSVILLCHSSSIEVVVHRETLSVDLTESLQPKLDISADTHCDAFEVACAQAVRRQLGLMLECMHKEFCWLRNIKYEVGFMCPICCQGRLLNYCNTHHKKDCEQEECLHFWSESDLRSTKQFVRCRKCASAKNNKVHVKQFVPWIRETSDELLTNPERDGRLLAAEGGNDETLFALFSKDLEALLLQPCDSKEVLLQVKRCLQLDQPSLEQPDPGTKKLIRCLAMKAKESNRLDVVKHLRVITPAGTTGPLLPERLDIRNIPVRQMTDLTVELSGGEDWKLIAEELGLTPQEIRFIDKRTLNPCEAVLAFISKHQYISVGSLYDVLNKSGLPVTADIL